MPAAALVASTPLHTPMQYLVDLGGLGQKWRKCEPDTIFAHDLIRACSRRLGLRAGIAAGLNFLSF